MDNELKQVFDFEDNDEMDLCLWCGDLLPSWQLNVNDGYCSQCLDKRPGSQE